MACTSMCVRRHDLQRPVFNVEFQRTVARTTLRQVGVLTASTLTPRRFLTKLRCRSTQFALKRTFVVFKFFSSAAHNLRSQSTGPIESAPRVPAAKALFIRTAHGTDVVVTEYVVTVEWDAQACRQVR